MTGPIAALERTFEELANRGGFTGAGGADQFEVFGFICGVDSLAGEGQAIASLDLRVFGIGSEQSAALVLGVWSTLARK